MKKSLKWLVSIVCVVVMSSMSMAVYAANKKPSAASTKQASKTKKAPAKKAVRGVKRSAASATQCKSVRVKTAKGYKTQRQCSGSNSALQNPAGAGDMNSAGGAKNELKARTIPDRAYAVDGYTFFHQGRKYRILGINEAVVPAGGDLAKQRLQMALDSGTVSVEPETVDESGTMRAVVKVAGKNLADVLNASR